MSGEGKQRYIETARAGRGRDVLPPTRCACRLIFIGITGG